MKTLQEQNAIFAESVNTIKSSEKMVKLAEQYAAVTAGSKDDFIRGFAAKLMRKTHPELY